MSSLSSPPRFGNHYVGEYVGTKTLTEYAGRNRFGHHLWYWRGDCCEEIQGPSSISHLRRSTRCLTCAFRRENNPRWKGYKELRGAWLTGVQNDAVKRGLVWDVTPEYLWEIWEDQRGCCIYTGRQLEHGVDASLDRRDNTAGYERGNLQWVHRDINRMKSDFVEDYFVALCSEVRPRE